MKGFAVQAQNWRGDYKRALGIEKLRASFPYIFRPIIRELDKHFIFYPKGFIHAPSAAEVMTCANREEYVWLSPSPWFRRHSTELGEDWLYIYTTRDIQVRDTIKGIDCDAVDLVLLDGVNQFFCMADGAFWSYFTTEEQLHDQLLKHVTALPGTSVEQYEYKDWKEYYHVT